LAQLVVRNLEEGVKAGLQRRARRHGRSMEEEVRDILREAANREPEPNRGGLGTTISGLFAKVGLHSEIPELRGHEVTPVTFD
jgi:antitoxin FitA